MAHYVLGISALYHNSAAALIHNGRVIAAAEEERFTRIKGDPSFPINAIKFCLDFAKIMPEDLFAVAFYENTSTKFERIMTSIVANIPRSLPQFLAAMPDWITNKLWIENKIRKELGYKGKVYSVPHHLSHAASAFFPSPFEDAAIITIDGVGEWSTLTWGIGENRNIILKKTLQYPNSLGLLYSAFTLYTGFKINNGEYKMMGLAPYGKPKYYDLIKQYLISIASDGSFVLNQNFFSYSYGLKTINARFEKLFGRKRRLPDEPILPFHADIAASIQKVTNEIVLQVAKTVRQKTEKKNLVMAGGVALNVTTNGLLRQSNIFDKIWIQPAAGDAGGAVGAALSAFYNLTKAHKKKAEKDLMNGAFLGSEIQNENKEDDLILKKLGAVWTTYDEETLTKMTAKLLAQGAVIGCARGRSEFGPRALGNRSIFADARDPKMLQKLNLKIKFREGFRPFAPIVLEEDASSFFDLQGSAPYMLFTFPVKKERRLPSTTADSLEHTASLPRSDIPSVTHVDYSARVQTVNIKDNSYVYGLLQEFKKLTGYGLMINTSFNTNQEPIVNSAADAYRCFMRSQIDYAIIGNRFFAKSEQKAEN